MDSWKGRVVWEESKGEKWIEWQISSEPVVAAPINSRQNYLLTPEFGTTTTAAARFFPRRHVGLKDKIPCLGWCLTRAHSSARGPRHALLLPKPLGKNASSMKEAEFLDSPRGENNLDERKKWFSTELSNFRVFVVGDLYSLTTPKGGRWRSTIQFDYNPTASSDV